MSNIDTILKIFQGSLTPVIAAIAVYIAWQQYALNREKLRFELKKKRLKVYQALTRFIGSMLRHADLKEEALIEYDTNVAEADFIFANNEAILNLLVNVRNVALSVMAANAEYRDWTQDQPPGYDHRKVVKTKHDGLRWLVDQQAVARKLFKPYLALQR